MKKTQWIAALVSIIAHQENAMAHPAFQGLRVGAQGGYALLDTKVKMMRSLQPGASDSSDVSGRGIIAGVLIDWVNLIGNTDLWMGVEGSLNITTAKGKKSTIGTFILSPAANDLTTTVKFSRTYDFTGKIGYMIGFAAVPYIKAGASWGHWKASSVSNAYPATGSGSGNILGVVAGIGAEFPMTNRISWGAEYNYRYYKSFSHTLNNSTGIAIRQVSVSPSSHAIMLRINYKMSGSDFSPTPPPKKVRKTKRTRNRS